METRILLFDLDGTLLRSDKTISERTLSAIERCRANGNLVGISTSRGETNCEQFIKQLNPNFVISSGGALVRVKSSGEVIFCEEFSAVETSDFIRTAREVVAGSSDASADVEITVDTRTEHFWNYKIDPKTIFKDWGDIIHTDYSDFHEASLKICVEIHDEEKAKILSEKFSDYDMIRFSEGLNSASKMPPLSLTSVSCETDLLKCPLSRTELQSSKAETFCVCNFKEGDWYKFTKKSATKENAILHLLEYCKLGTENLIAFGDDFADIGMLKMAGVGVAMGNAIPEVKKIADVVIGTNDEDVIAEWLENNFPN